ncbi:hypothetical protein [Amycolatopsis sp. NPDC051903]|uniref:hypothetical protein n=1 Tax=Amycolatopsis sp. NPDC051903 TaxID=3363936 RepID=UPI0037B9CE0A
MSELVVVESAGRRPRGHRAVPLLSEHGLGHYPEFRDFLSATFGLTADPWGPPGLLSVGGRYYELVFVGYSGHAFPAGVQVNALVAGLEPMDEQAADFDLWSILQWLVAGVGGQWTVEGLVTTGRIYRIPAAASDGDTV